MKIAKQKEAEELLESKIKNERKIAAEYREENQTLEVFFIKFLWQFSPARAVLAVVELPARLPWCSK